MARINAEEQWWTDPRRSLLIRLIGNEDGADGAALKMWRLAQTFWVSGRRLVPVEIFKSMAQCENLMKAGLASIEGDMVYVRGSSAYLDWIIEQREMAKANGSKGGKKSAQRPRNEKGHFYPAGVQAEPKQESKPSPSEPQAEPSKPKLSYSYSSSNKHTPSKVFEHPTAAMNRRMSVCVEVVEEFRNLVNQAFENKVPPRIRNRIQDLASQFQSPENFEAHLNEILHLDQARPGEPKRLNFIEGCLLRQLEVI